MKVHFISYGDEGYHYQKRMIRDSASHSCFFDTLSIFGREDLPQDFQKQFAYLLNQSRGGGYWIWKPYLLYIEMSKLNDGDILVYCDAGCMINKRGQVRFEQYIAMLLDSPTGSLAFELAHKEKSYTKQEAIDYFQAPVSVIDSNQLVGGILMLRKCTHTINLVNSFYTAMQKAAWMFTDELTMSYQCPDFIAHRHDQSIFSLIRKIEGTIIIPDETWFKDFPREGFLFPFWATRLRDSSYVRG